MTRLSRCLLLLSISGLLWTSCSEKKKKYDDPKSVDEEIKSFHVAEGFVVKNVAAEPEVAMPVAMTIDEDANTYVVQMIDYPFIADSLNGKCSIKVLLDTNNDGQYDSSVLFVNKVPDITSILPYKQGLLVAAAPHIFYMKDTNGDLTADKIDTLFSGFFTGNSEAQITNLSYGLDNWIYANNHGQAGMVKFLPKQNEEALSMGGHDFRFRLDKGLFEAESGTGQFGLALNDLNHRFFTQNTLHIQTNPIAWRYLQRHKLLSSYKGEKNISDHELEMFQLTQAPYWRRVRSERRQHQYDSMKLGRVEWMDKHFTGASGATFYGGDAFPGEYYGSVFTGEVAGNLVHRDKVIRTENDVIYKASRGATETDKEFLASTDSWFRPASLYAGPDGNLFIVDMYRQHIETPVSIPEDLKEEMDFYAGNNMGRIFLVAPTTYDARTYKKPAMSKMTSAELVQYLAHPNAWWRTNAQRVLVERQDKTVVEPVRALFLSSVDARSKLRALYTLDGLDAVTVDDVKKALADKDPGVREHAIILAERYPSLTGEIVKLVDDPARFVAFQAVLSIGNATPSTAIPVLAKALNQYSEDSIFTVGILTSEPGISAQMLPAISRTAYFSSGGKFKEMYLNAIGYAFGLKDAQGNMNSLYTLLSAAEIKSNPTWIKSAVSGLLRGIKASKRTSQPAEMTDVLKKLAALTQDEDIKKQLATF